MAQGGCSAQPSARVREVVQPPQLLLGEERGLSTTALIPLDEPAWAEQLCAQQGCRAGRAGPPAQGWLPASASATSPLQGDADTAQRAAL